MAFKGKSHLNMESAPLTRQHRKMKTMLARLVMVVMSVASAAFVYSTDLQAQGCNNDKATEVQCYVQECIATSQLCGEPGSGNVIWEDCLKLTGFKCGGNDDGCNCIVALSEIDCPIKTTCAPAGGTTSCTTFNASGCGTVENDRYTNCGGDGCQPALLGS